MNFSSSKFLKAVGIVMICGLAFPGLAMATTYRVKSGDSLWAIARQYGTTVNQLQSLNNITGSLIFPGQVLTVDGRQDTPTNNGGGSTSTYTVKGGDSLWTIAVRYGTTVSELQRLNGISGSLIFPGQVLTINGQSNPAPSTPPAPPASSNTGSTTTYTVRSGDSLWTIAVRYGTTVRNLQQLNGISGSMIYPGQVLRVSGQAQVPTGNNPAPTPSRGGNPQEIVSTALRFLGAPYRWGGTSPSGFDCSGFVQYVFSLNGISLPRITREQANAGTKIWSISALQPGDIVYFGKGIDHVAIYAGNGQIVTTSNSKGCVIETSIYGYWDQHFTNGVRVL